MFFALTILIGAPLPLVTLVRLVRCLRESGAGFVWVGWWRWSKAGEMRGVCPRPYASPLFSLPAPLSLGWQVRCAPIPQRHQKGGQRQARGVYRLVPLWVLAHTELASAMARMVRNMCRRRCSPAVDVRSSLSLHVFLSVRASPQPKFSPHRIIIQHRTSKTQRQSTYLVRGIQDSVTSVLRSELCGHPRKQKTRYRSSLGMA